LGQIEDLRLFVFVVESGSISKAAGKLRIAKSAVSRRLGLLEDRYGAALINRQPGVWNITDTGKELYQRSVVVVGDADEIAADFTQAPQTVGGPLTISVPQEFGTTFLSPVLIAFSRRHRDIQLNIEFDNRTVDLSRENYDFAIRVSPRVESEIYAKHIGTSRHHLYASKGYLDAHGAPKSVKDLKEHALLNYGTTKRAEWAFTSESGKSTKVAFKPAMSSNSGVLLVDAACHGLGIARLPDFVGRSSYEKGELVDILPDLKPTPLNIYLIHAEKRRLNRRMRIFAEEMALACSAPD